MRGNLFQINGNEKKPMVLPDAVGAAVNLSEKVYVPVKEFPDVSLIIFSLHIIGLKFTFFSSAVQFRRSHFRTTWNDGQTT